MIHIIIWVIIFAIWYFYHVYKASKEEEEREYDAFVERLMNSDNDKEKEDNMNVGKCLDERTTTGLVLTTLRSIGCEPETEEKGGLNYAYFTFQGE